MPHSKKKRNRKTEQVPGPYRQQKKFCNINMTVILIILGPLETVQEHGIVNNGGNTEKSPGNLRRLAVMRSENCCYEKLVKSEITIINK